MANEFEFELANGQKVFTGMRQPETRSLMFAESKADPFSITEALEILNNQGRKPARERYDWILNQGRRSSCNVRHAAIAALMRARVRCGHDSVELAPEYLYALINGGQDRGSLLFDGMRELCNSGAPPRDMVPYESYQLSDMSIEAKRIAKNYRALECEQMPTSSVETHWAMMVSEVLRGHSLVTAVHVGKMVYVGRPKRNLWSRPRTRQSRGLCRWSSRPHRAADFVERFYFGHAQQLGKRVWR